MKATKILLIGHQGKLNSTMSELVKVPLIELDTDKLDCSYVELLILNHEATIAELIGCFEPSYQAWGRYGYMGDVLGIRVINFNETYLYFLDFIGRLAIIKPGLAVDLLTVIRIKDGDYFIGIKRRFNPGKGKLALPGGFLDVNGYHLDTPLETIVHEAQEEIGLMINVVNPFNLSSYELVEGLVEVKYNSKIFNGELIPLGIIPTGDNEKMPSIGIKRVYHTTAYGLFLDMTQSDLDEDGISDWLKAGDDAASLVIVNLKQNPKPEFGLSHHKELFNSFMMKLKIY
jgi:8-oxo-dGTP pyrophosphatase MutT (NUDIX family)